MFVYGKIYFISATGILDFKKNPDKDISFFDSFIPVTYHACAMFLGLRDIFHNSP